MSTRRGRMGLGIGAGLSLLLLGGLGGMALDRVRFELERAALLARVEAVVRANQGTPWDIPAFPPR